jgi:hypothetical protein
MPAQTAPRTSGAPNFAERRARADARESWERSTKSAPPLAASGGRPFGAILDPARPGMLRRSCCFEKENNTMKRLIYCPWCPKLHEIVEITIERDKLGDEQHIAHVYCDALGREVTARLVLVRRDGR